VAAAPITKVIIRCRCEQHPEGEHEPEIVLEPKGDSTREPLPVIKKNAQLSDEHAWMKGYRRLFSAAQPPTEQAVALLLWAAQKRANQPNVNSKSPMSYHRLLPADAQNLVGWTRGGKVTVGKQAIYAIVGYPSEEATRSEVLEQVGGKVRIKPGVEVQIGTTPEERAAVLQWAGLVPKEAKPKEPVTSPPATVAPTQPTSHARPSSRTAPVSSASLDQLRERVCATLQRNPGLFAALAASGLCKEGEPAQGTEALLHTPAATVTKHVADIVSRGFHQQAARDLLWDLLPLSVNWEKVLAQANATGAGSGSLVLPLRTATVAEIVLARIEARRCRFAPGDVVPQGALHVPFPAAQQSAIISLDAENLVDAVLLNLVSEQAPKGFGDRDEAFWHDIKKQTANDEEFCLAATEEINLFRNAGARPYLLMIDAMLDPQGTKDVDRSWELANEVLGKALPGLRLVRLKGRVEAYKEEAGFPPQIRRVRDGY
jgi:hypothetical protein